MSGDHFDDLMRDRQGSEDEDAAYEDAAYEERHYDLWVDFNDIDGHNDGTNGFSDTHGFVTTQIRHADHELALGERLLVGDGEGTVKAATVVRLNNGLVTVELEE